MKKTLAVVFVFLCTVIACKKKDNNTPIVETVPCDKIIGAVDSTSSNNKIEYTLEWKDGHMISYHSKFLNRTFSYKGDSIFIVEYQNDGMPNNYDTVILDKNGLMVQEYGDWGYRNLSYDTQGQLTRNAIYRKHTGGVLPVTDTIDYKWENGNLIEGYDGKKHLYFDYYNDKEFVSGDYLYYDIFKSHGQMYIRNKNMLKSRTNEVEGITSTFTYEMENNRVKTITEYHNTIGQQESRFASLTTFSYPCN